MKKMPFVSKLLRQSLTYAVIGFVIGSVLVVLMNQYAAPAQISRINGMLEVAGMNLEMIPIVLAIILYVVATIQVVSEFRQVKKLDKEIKDSNREIAEMEAQLREGGV